MERVVQKGRSRSTQRLGSEHVTASGKSSVCAQPKASGSNSSSATAWSGQRDHSTCLDMGPHGAFAATPSTGIVLGRLRSWPQRRGAKSKSRRILLHAMALRRSMVLMCTFRPRCIRPRRQVQPSPCESVVCAFLRLPKPSTQRLQAACRIEGLILLFVPPLASPHCPQATPANCFHVKPKTIISIALAPVLGAPCLLADVIPGVD
jgi:hypothetical protein